MHDRKCKVMSLAFLCGRSTAVVTGKSLKVVVAEFLVLSCCAWNKTAEIVVTQPMCHQISAICILCRICDRSCAGVVSVHVAFCVDKDCTIMPQGSLGI